MSGGQREVLSTVVVPKHYFVRLEPDFEKFTFKGLVKIDVSIEETQETKIWLNSNEIEAQSAVMHKGGAVIQTSGIEFDEKLERMALSFPQALPQGDAQLEIAFTGILNDKMKGFYRSKYQVDGKDQWMGTTQFESTDGRRAFPMWDEPSVKATFEVELVVPKDLEAVSNMPVSSSTEEGEKKVVRFETTPKMSTYLLAWTISKLDKIETTIKKHHSGGETLVRVWTTPGKTASTQFALDVAAKVLPFFEEYYGIDYPLPKSDLLAVPDFSAGAMENWGLVTYREICLFCDENSSLKQKYRVCMTVAHELAHQWFGNLVTMSWWNELWLNEGFACFMQYLATDHCYPEWKIWESFVTDEVTAALSQDAMKSSHPIEVEINRAVEIDDIFDAISYCKGATVIRMLQSFLGPEKFRKGLASYLDKYKYSNATTVNLWDSLSESSGVNVAELMAKWTSKQGYPYLQASCDFATGKVNMSQSRFLGSGKASAEDDTVEWCIPIIGASKKDAEPVEVRSEMKERKGEVQFPEGSKWIKLNYGQTGCHRVNYSEEMLAPLGEAVKAGELPVVDRLGLVLDVSSLSKAGMASTASFLELLQNYDTETETSVVEAMVRSLSSIREMLQNDLPTQSSFDTFICSLLGEQGKALGWEPKEGEHPNTANRRAAVIGLLCDAGSKEFNEAAVERFDKYVAGDKGAVLQDLRAGMFRSAMATGDKKRWEALVAMLTDDSDVAQRDSALRCVGLINNQELLQETGKMGLGEGSVVRSQDFPFLLAGIATNSKADGAHVAFGFLTDNWKTIVQRLGGGGFMLSLTLKASCARFGKVEDLKKLDAWWSTIPEEEQAMVGRSFQQARETVEINTAWITRDGPGVKEWLSKKGF